ADRRRKAYVITSPGPLEGKTPTAGNLAIAISETGRNVLLVDGDLYRPCIHRYFNLRNDTGLTNLLADSDVELQSLLRPTDVKTLRVITSGPRSPKPSELIKKDVPERVLEALKEEAEVVIVDAPPVLARSDAVRLVHCGDGTIILADANTTRTGSLKRTMELLETSKSDDRESLLAVVLNRFKPPRLAYYVYYRYYDEYRHYYGEREVLEHRSTGRGGTRRYKESKSWWGMFRMKKVKKIVTRRIRGVTDDTDR
ncbi:MAG: CpsD/CapB family tyrosine-protein kinase, partial [Dehalococcoidia bacterium]